MRSSGRGRPKILAPFGLRDFALYWTARTVSFLGDGVRPVMIGCGVLGLIFTVAAFLLPGMRETEGKVSLASG